MKACHCGSDQRYADCCRPFHRGEREVPDAPSLVRARFCAYALKDVAFLWKTLHPAHPDRQGDEREAARELRATASALRYVRLHLLDSREAGDSAEVLFLAEIFEKGRDRSFFEHSTFRRAEGGWRYLSGDPATAKDLPAEARGWGIERYSARGAQAQVEER